MLVVGVISNGAYQDLEPRNIFLIVSKQDGSVVEEIKVPFEKKVSQVLFERKGHRYG